MWLSGVESIVLIVRSDIRGLLWNREGLCPEMVDVSDVRSCLGVLLSIETEETIVFVSCDLLLQDRQQDHNIKGIL